MYRDCRVYDEESNEQMIKEKVLRLFFFLVRLGKFDHNRSALTVLLLTRFFLKSELSKSIILLTGWLDKINMG